VRRREVEYGGIRRWCGRGRPAWGGRERADRRGPSSARGEREDAEDGRRESKKKTYSAQYAKGARRPSGPSKGMVTCGRGGPAQ
jgi:hypothetical protein